MNSSKNFQIRNRTFQDIFDEIDNYYSKKWRSVTGEDDEDTLNIFLSILAASKIISDTKERKTREPNRFLESG